MREFVTEEIKTKSIAYFPDGITTEELRLMPYICYVLQNEKRIDWKKVNNNECATLQVWEDNGWIGSMEEEMWVREDFWDIMNKLIFMSYVNKWNGGKNGSN